jgi:hypothetical protein
MPEQHVEEHAHLLSEAKAHTSWALVELSGAESVCSLINAVFVVVEGIDAVVLTFDLTSGRPSR